MPVFILIYATLVLWAWSVFVVDVYRKSRVSPHSLTSATLAAVLWPLSFAGLLVVYLTRDERGD